MMKKILLLFCLVFGLSFVPTAQAAMISEKQEIEMGERAGKALEAQYGLYQDDEWQAASTASESPCRSFDAADSLYLQSPQYTGRQCSLVPAASSMSIRAFVDTMTSDDELAAVLGHEIGHIESAIPSIRLKNRWPVPSYHPCWRGQQRILAQDWPLLPPRSVRPSAKLQSGEMGGEADQEGFRL